MDIRSLRHFVAVAEQSSFSRAADLLHITQPALSRSIARLEGECGIRLFDRTPDGVTLTAVGEIVHSRAMLMLSEWARTLAAIDAARSGDEGEVVLGVPPGLQKFMIADVIARLAEERPRLKLKVVSGLTGGVSTTLLHKGELDLILGPIGRAADTPELNHEPLFSDYVAVFVRGQNPLLAQPTITLERLAQCRWVLFGQDVPSRHHLAGFFTAAGLRLPEPLVECDSPELAVSLVTKTDLVGYLPRRYYLAALADRTIVEVSLERLVWHQIVGVSYSKTNGLSPGGAVVLRELRQLVKDGSARFEALKR